MKNPQAFDESTRLIGKNVELRLVREDDGAFVHRLRTDRDLSRHLSPVTGTIADQTLWIKHYKVREGRSEEFYFVVETKGHIPCGLVRLYDIAPPVFTWGSIVLGENKPRKAALETAVLSLGFGFSAIGCALAKLDVRRENARAIAFYRRFGMQQTGDNRRDLFFEMSKEDFATRWSRYFEDPTS